MADKNNVTSQDKKRPEELLSQIERLTASCQPNITAYLFRVNDALINSNMILTQCYRCPRAVIASPDVRGALCRHCAQAEKEQQDKTVYDGEKAKQEAKP